MTNNNNGIKNRALGMGIATLLGGHNNPYISTNQAIDNVEVGQSFQVSNLDINLISPNPNQPRKEFDESKLLELSESIVVNGLLQPILITKQDDRYIIVAGERRYRAVKMAGLDKIKAIVLNLNQKEVLKNAIIENVQREDLNPVEEAIAYRNMIDTFGYTHEAIAKEVGKSRSHITNLLRILLLPDEILLALKQNKISLGHAKVLLSVDDPMKFLDQIISEELSVRNLEKEIEKQNKQQKFTTKEEINLTSPEDITYEMIKMLYQPMLEAQQQQEQDDKAKNTTISIKDSDIIAIEENIKTIEKHIRDHTNLNITLKIDSKTMHGNLSIHYQNPEELLNIINRIFFNQN